MATSVSATRRPYRKFKKQEETNLQLRVCRYIKREYPHVIFCSDSAAGLNMSDAQRINMVKMRSDDGQPDISIDFPSRGYHGLRIELKKEGTVLYKQDGTLRKDPYVRRFRNGTVKRGDHLAEQAAMLLKYNEAGYLGRFCVGYDATIKLIDWYMERPEQIEIF